MFGLLINVLFVKIVFEFAVKPLLCDLPREQWNMVT